MIVSGQTQGSAPTTIFAINFPDVGVIPRGYPLAYVHGWMNFRADTGVCPYAFKFSDVWLHTSLHAWGWCKSRKEYVMPHIKK